MIASISKGGGSRVPTSLRLYRLNPKNGQQLWEYNRSIHPGQLDFLNNEILLQFHDKLEVLKFLSL